MAVQKAGNSDLWAQFTALVPKHVLEAPGTVAELSNPVDSVVASPAIDTSYQSTPAPTFTAPRIDEAPSLDLQREVANHIMSRQMESHMARQAVVQQGLDRYNYINGNQPSASPAMGYNMTGQPGYMQPGFGQPGYVDPRFAQPGYVDPRFQPGYIAPGQPGYVQPQPGVYTGSVPTNLSWR